MEELKAAEEEKLNPGTAKKKAPAPAKGKGGKDEPQLNVPKLEVP